MKPLVRLASRLLALTAVLMACSVASPVRADNYTASLIDSVHTRLGDSTTSWISLHNETDSVVTVYATLSGPDSSYFRLSSYTINLGADTLSAGTLLYFIPTSARTYSLTLTLSDGQSIQTYHIIGVCTETPTGLVTSMMRVRANIGDSAQGYVSWYNPSTHNDTILAANILAMTPGNITIDANQLPLVIRSRMYGRINFTFSPMAAVSEIDTMLIMYREEAGNVRYAEGYIMVDGIGTPDTSIEDMADDSTQTIRVNGTRPGPIQHVVEIRNNTGAQRRVESVGMMDGSHFSAEVTAPTSVLPFELPDLSSMSVLVTLLDDTPGTYNDTIIVVTSDGLQALRFPVTGTRGPVADVRDASSARVEILATPNPTTGQLRLTFSALRDAEVSVWDFLGRQLVPSQRLHSGETVTGLESLSSGSYVVRVNAITDDGRAYIKTLPFVLQR